MTMEVQARDASATRREDTEDLLAAAGRLRAEVGRRIIGQEKVVEEVLIAMMAGGHALLVGVPGLAKTLLVSSIAEAMRLEFRRIQFTPDLVPSDITGTELLEEDHATGRREFRFVRGPIFSNIVLADEINRTPPKTQAALLQAMQERAVTAAGDTMQLDRPFFVQYFDWLGGVLTGNMQIRSIGILGYVGVFLFVVCCLGVLFHRTTPHSFASGQAVGDLPSAGTRGSL